jgi:hypothetical protein
MRAAHVWEASGPRPAHRPLLHKTLFMQCQVSLALCRQRRQGRRGNDFQVARASERVSRRRGDARRNLKQVRHQRERGERRATERGGGGRLTWPMWMLMHSRILNELVGVGYETCDARGVWCVVWGGEEGGWRRFVSSSSLRFQGTITTHKIG